MNYSKRQYQPGDEEEIVKLLDEVFKGWPKFDLQCSPLDHWRWKFIDNPPKVTVVSLAIYKGKIIGSSHGLPQKLKIGEQIFLSCQGADAATHPDFRGMGIHNELKSFKDLIMKNAAINFYYSVSANPILINKNKREEHPALPLTLENLLRIHDIDLHLKKASSERDLIKKYGFHTLRTINKLKRNAKIPPKIHDDFKVTEIGKFDDRMDRFWSKISIHYKLIVQRDRDYLNWRYCDTRGGKYDIRVVEADDCILGYMVLRVNKYVPDYPTGYIVDLLALPDRPDVVRELARDAVEFFDSKDINMIQINVLKNSSVEPFFQSLGFINHPVKPFMNYPAEYSNECLNGLNQREVNKMHFSYGDYDWI